MEPNQVTQLLFLRDSIRAEQDTLMTRYREVKPEVDRIEKRLAFLLELSEYEKGLTLTNEDGSQRASVGLAAVFVQPTPAVLEPMPEEPLQPGGYATEDASGPVSADEAPANVTGINRRITKGSGWLPKSTDLRRPQPDDTDSPA